MLCLPCNLHVHGLFQQPYHPRPVSRNNLRYHFLVVLRLWIQKTICNNFCSTMPPIIRFTITTFFLYIIVGCLWKGVYFDNCNLQYIEQPTPINDHVSETNNNVSSQSGHQIFNLFLYRKLFTLIWLNFYMM